MDQAQGSLIKKEVRRGATELVTKFYRLRREEKANTSVVAAKTTKKTKKSKV